MDSNCKFYELDEVAKAECEAEMAAYRESIGEEAFLAEQQYIEDMSASMGEECDNLAQCREFCKHLAEGKGYTREFCKHLAEGKGYPGEYVYYCNCPGHEQILHVDFNESEII